MDGDGFEFETVQSIPFRTCIESLKEVLIDTTWRFHPEGVDLVCMDNTKSIIVQLKLFKSHIERYHSTKAYEVSFNLNMFFKIVKTVTTADSIILRYSENDPYILTTSIESIEKRSINTYRMKLLEMHNMETLTFDVDKFNTVLQMQSTYFQKICKDLINTGGRYVEITVKNSSVSFKSKDSLLETEMELFETLEGLNFKKKETCETPQTYGQFLLKYLITFTKCTTLCPVVNLYLHKDYPLVLQYSVANLGIIRFCVAALESNEV